VIKTKTYSVFGETTVPISALGDTNLTLGVRYNKDKREAAGYILGDGTLPLPPSIFFFGVVNPPAIPNQFPFVAGGEKEFKKTTYRVILDHRFTPNLMTYASYNLGFKAGNFNTVAFPTLTSYEPETLKAAEIGAKSQWWDGRLQLNASIFHYKYKDMQLPIYLGPSLTTINASTATLKGVEIEGEVLPIDNLSIRFNATFEKGEFDSFPVAFVSIRPKSATM
jgi:iron complex outermembrane receptor protein